MSVYEVIMTLFGAMMFVIALITLMLYMMDMFSKRK